MRRRSIHQNQINKVMGSRKSSIKSTLKFHLSGSEDE